MIIPTQRTFELKTKEQPTALKNRQFNLNLTKNKNKSEILENNCIK